MKNLFAPAFVSTYPPEVSELADFTKHLANFVDQAAGERLSFVCAVQEHAPMSIKQRIAHVIDRNDVSSSRE